MKLYKEFFRYVIPSMLAFALISIMLSQILVAVLSQLLLKVKDNKNR